MPLALVLAALWPALPAAAGPAPTPGPEVVPGEVVVGYESGASPAQRRAVRREGAGVLGKAAGDRVEVLRTEPGQTVETAAAELERLPGVRFAEPNYVVRLSSNDPSWSSLWGLENVGQSGGVADADVDAPDAWAVTRGTGATVAVVDTGVDVTHPDLVGGTAAGWDWVEGDAIPQDAHGHGTHVAGTIAARAENGIGVAGVAPEAVVMPLRVLGADGSGTTADVAAAFAYAGGQGVDVVNASLGGGGYSQAMADAIQGAPGTLFVVAAGNDGTDNDVSPMYPCNIAASNIVCVAATTRADAIASFSNRGATSVDLGAPGSSIYSTLPGGYGWMSGTSMATPHVAGAAALLASTGAGPEAIRSALLASVDPVASLAGVTVSGGRLNAAVALQVPDVGLPAALIAPTLAPLPPTMGALAVQLGWSAVAGAASYDIGYRRAVPTSGFGEPTDWIQGSTETAATLQGEPGSTYCFSSRSTGLDMAPSPWSEETCTTLPVDDQALGRRGPWRLRAGEYLKGYSSSSVQGAALLAGSVRAKRIAIIVTRCPGCGRVEVWFAGRLLRSIRLGAATTRRGRVIEVAFFAGERVGRLKAVVASSGRPVRIEGLVVAAA